MNAKVNSLNLYARHADDYRDEAHAVEERTTQVAEAALNSICMPRGLEWVATPDRESQYRGIDYTIIGEGGLYLHVDVKAVDTHRMVGGWERWQQQYTSVEIEQTTSAGTIRPGWGVDDDKDTDLILWVWADASTYGVHEWMLVDHRATRDHILTHTDHYHEVRATVGCGARLLLLSPSDYHTAGLIRRASWGSGPPPLAPRWYPEAIRHREEQRRAALARALADIRSR